MKKHLYSKIFLYQFRFCVINPTTFNYSFNWLCLDPECELNVPPFVCHTPSGCLPCAKRQEVREMHFHNLSVSPIELIVNIIVNVNITVLFLYITTIISSCTTFSHNKIKFLSSLLFTSY